MKHWIQSSLKNKLFVFIFLSVIIPVFLLGIVSYISAVNISKERAEISGASVLKQLQTSLNFIIEDVEGMSVFLIGNRDVQDYMQGENYTPRQRSNINGFLANLAYSKEYISNISLYPGSDNPVISTNAKETEKRYFNENMGNTWWTYLQYEKKTQGVSETITFTRPIRSLSDFRTIGHLSINLNKEYINELLRTIDVEWNGSFILMNDNFVLANSNKKEVNQHSMDNIIGHLQESEEVYLTTETVEGSKSTLFSAKINGVDWHIVGIIPYGEYSSQNRYLLLLTVVTIVIAATFVILLTIFLVLRILNPLLSLADRIRHTNPGETIKELPQSKNNEIGELISSYNALNERISYLMDKVKESESRKRQVDLQALQNQINPHFLYNTLASIHWIALSSGSTDISEMVSSLGKYLRYSLNKGDEYCTVEQEIDHLRQYTNVQKIRFPDAFSIESDIPETVKHFTMLKLLLQPMIENSILHGKHPGINDKVRVTIQIRRKTGRLNFAVEDDGIGISATEITMLNQMFLKDRTEKTVIGKKYGLRNVNLRLLMHYDDKAGLKLSVGKSKGLRIAFSIPIEEEW